MVNTHLEEAKENGAEHWEESVAVMEEMIGCSNNKDRIAGDSLESLADSSNAASVSRSLEEEAQSVSSDVGSTRPPPPDYTWKRQDAERTLQPLPPPGECMCECAGWECPWRRMSSGAHEAGAYAVRSFRTGTAPRWVYMNMSWNETAIGSTSNGNRNTREYHGNVAVDDPLIEAHLVEGSQGDDDSLGIMRMTSNMDLVVAQAVDSDHCNKGMGASQPASKAFWVSGLIVAVIVAFLLVVVIVLLLVRDDGDAAYLNKYDHFLGEHSYLDGENFFHCIHSSEELYAAVDAYYLDSSPHSDVVKRYGWPMGTWCVRHVTRFAHVFDPSRVRSFDHSDTDMIATMAKKARHFSIHIGSWDMAQAQNAQGMFQGVQNMSMTAWGIYKWDTLEMINMQALFQDTHWVDDQQQDSNASLSTPTSLYTINLWDVSKVQTLEQAFRGALGFNVDLSNWKVSQVTSLQSSFEGAASFRQNLCAWGALLPSNATTTNMFRGTACPNTSDPILSEGGPFCFNCD